MNLEHKGQTKYWATRFKAERANRILLQNGIITLWSVAYESGKGYYLTTKESI